MVGEWQDLACFYDGACSLQVAVPSLFPGLVSPSVLVESYESGRSVAHFAKARTPINTQIVSLGVDAYLAMLLKCVCGGEWMLNKTGVEWVTNKMVVLLYVCLCTSLHLYQQVIKHSGLRPGNGCTPGCDARCCGLVCSSKGALVIVWMRNTLKIGSWECTTTHANKRHAYTHAYAHTHMRTHTFMFALTQAQLCAHRPPPRQHPRAHAQP